MIDISIGYIFVATEKENTTSCGLYRSFQNFDVHNLFTGYMPNACFIVPLMRDCVAIIEFALDKTEEIVGWKKS